jgi:beta-N-acetylhexosaminidase
MVAHLEVPALTTERNPLTGRLVPASLSREVLRDLLRGELGFEGLVVSDALNMGGVTTQWPPGEVAVRSVLAGVDLLLCFNPESYAVQFDAIREAVRSDRIAPDVIDSAVRHVLGAKDRFIGEAPYRSDPAESQALCAAIAEGGVTLLGNREGLLPLRSLSGKRVAVLECFSPDRDTLVGQGQPSLTSIVATLLRDRGIQVDRYEIGPDLALGQVHEILDLLPGHDVVFVNLFGVPSWGIGTMIPNRNALRLFMFGLLTRGFPVVVTAFGDPYVRGYCPAARTFLCTFDESEWAQRAAVAAWLGECPVTGRMPVRMDQFFERGDGIVP